MKDVFFLFGFFLFSCNNESTSEYMESSQVVDSVLFKSQQNILQSEFIQKKSDSITKNQVNNVVKEFKILTNEITKYKMEKLTILNEIKLMNENMVKNDHLDKEISINSDSLRTLIYELISNNKNIVDTVQN